MANAIATLIELTLRELSNRFNAIDYLISDAIGQDCIREQGSRAVSGSIVARTGFDCACSAPAPTVVSSLPSEQGSELVTPIATIIDALVAALDAQADNDARADYIARGSWIRV